MSECGGRVSGRLERERKGLPDQQLPIYIAASPLERCLELHAALRRRRALEHVRESDVCPALIGIDLEQPLIGTPCTRQIAALHERCRKVVLELELERRLPHGRLELGGRVGVTAEPHQQMPERIVSRGIGDGKRPCPFDGLLGLFEATEMRETPCPLRPEGRALGVQSDRPVEAIEREGQSPSGECADTGKKPAVGIIRRDLDDAPERRLGRVQVTVAQSPARLAVPAVTPTRGCLPPHAA